MTINNGTLQLSNGGNNGTLSSSTSISGTGGTLSLNRCDDIAFNNPISGAVNLSKENNDTVTLPGTYSYTGTTAIQSGTLLVTGVLPSNGTVNINNDSTLSGTGDGVNSGVVGRVNLTNSGHIRPGGSAADGSVGTLTMGSLSVSSGELRFDLGATSDRITVTGAAVFNGGSITIAGTPAPNTYTILTAGALTLNTPPQVISPTDSNIRAASYTLNTSTPNTLKINVTGGPANITWVGNLNSNAWDIHTTQNWLNGASDFFFNLDNVNFTNSGNHTVNIANGDVSPGSAIFSHTTGTYTVNGPNGISGNASVAITGGGTVVMNSNNSYTGTTAVQNGTLVVGNSNAIPNTSALTLGNGATSGAVDLAGSERHRLRPLHQRQRRGQRHRQQQHLQLRHTHDLQRHRQLRRHHPGLDQRRNATRQRATQRRHDHLQRQQHLHRLDPDLRQRDARPRRRRKHRVVRHGQHQRRRNPRLQSLRHDHPHHQHQRRRCDQHHVGHGADRERRCLRPAQLRHDRQQRRSGVESKRHHQPQQHHLRNRHGLPERHGNTLAQLQQQLHRRDHRQQRLGPHRRAGAQGNNGTITLNGGTFVATATLAASPIVFGGGTFGVANSPAVLSSGDLYVLANTTTNLLAGDPQTTTTSNGTFTGSMHGTGTLLTSVVATANHRRRRPGHSLQRRCQ